MADEAADLPIGAVVLLSDGADNSGGIDLDTISALRSRHIPVHTVGFGRGADARMTWKSTTPWLRRARLADSRLAAKITFHQRGYAGQKVDADCARRRTKVLAARQITLAAGRQRRTKLCCSMRASAGAKTLQFAIDPLPGEENRANNSVTRLVNVESEQAAHPLCRRRAALGI